MKRLVFILAFCMAACGTLDKLSRADALTLTPVSYQALDGWQKDDLSAFFDAFTQSCSKIKFKNDNDSIHSSHIGGKVEAWKPICQKLASITPQDVATQRQFLEQHFTPHLVSKAGDANGKFTGYFEASLEGSYIKSDVYRYPVYQLPSEFTSGDSFYSRKEIDQGVLEGKGLELLWVNDDVKLFFAHVQGSATVQLDDGSATRIGFAGKTAHPYHAIGKYLIEEGHIAKDDVNAESIKAWLYMNPDSRQEVYAYNPSYIFFREIKSQGGPIGGQNVPLTAERSLAVDKALIPYGVPIWLDTTLTRTKAPYQRLLMAQDTGSAIKGAIRGDIFFGYGEAAEQNAAYQHSDGQWYLLLPTKR